MTDKEKLEIALNLLAEWVVAIERNGTGWDDWDEHYKDVSWRASPIRQELDTEMEEVRKQYAN